MAGALSGVNADFTGALGSAGLFASISDSLPAKQFPQFTSAGAGSYGGATGRGAFVDDARLVVDGTTVDTSDFEAGLGLWTAAAAPAGSPGNVVGWAQSDALLHSSAAISTGHSCCWASGWSRCPLPHNAPQLLRRR